LQEKANRDEALRIAANGGFARSEPVLLQIAQRHPDDAAVVKELVLGYLRADRFAEAEPYFEKWCQSIPNDPNPYLLRISMWVKWNRLRNAVADAQHVLMLQPDNRKLNQDLTRWLLIVGDFDEAEQECRRYLQRWPGDPWVLLVQGLVYQKEGRQREAAAIADQLVVRDIPDFYEAYQLRGILYNEANQPQEAIPWLRRALAVKALKELDRRDALFALAWALNQVGQKQEAEQIMKEARLLQEQAFLIEMASEFGPRPSASARARLGEELLNSGKSEEGLRLLAKLLEQDPNCFAAHQVLANYYDKQGKPEKAAEHRRHLNINP
jgi:tetratricopeptide (TPR) repeat protein